MKFRFVVLVTLLLVCSFAWAGDNDSQVPFLVSQVSLTRADASTLAVREQGGRTELLIEHLDGTVDSVDVTNPWSPKLRERIPWPTAVRVGNMAFVGQLALSTVCENCPSTTEPDRALVLVDSSGATSQVAIRIDHMRDQKMNGDFLYVLTSNGVSILRVRPEPDPVALASLYGG